MSAVQGSVVPNQWSSCSVNSITTALSTTSLGSCLTNVPTTTVGVPKCGNGIREGNETCDCGSPQVSSHQCCVQALQILCACYAHQHAYGHAVQDCKLLAQGLFYISVGNKVIKLVYFNNFACNDTCRFVYHRISC